jgi:hypothetical protein
MDFWVSVDLHLKPTIGATMSIQRALGIGAGGEVGQATASDLIAAGVQGLAAGRERDATDPEQVAALLDEADPDLVVVAAGVPPHMASIEQQTWESFSKTWDVDVRIAFEAGRAALARPLRPGSDRCDRVERRRVGRLTRGRRARGVARARWRKTENHVGRAFRLELTLDAGVRPSPWLPAQSTTASETPGLRGRRERPHPGARSAATRSRTLVWSIGHADRCDAETGMRALTDADRAADLPLRCLKTGQSQS